MIRNIDSKAATSKISLSLEQNRRQKILNRGLYVCAGGLDNPKSW